MTHASFAALREAWHCREHFWIPEAELRSVFTASADGSVGAARTPRAVHARHRQRTNRPGLLVDPRAGPGAGRYAADEDRRLRPEDQQPRNDEEGATILAFNTATKAFMDRWSAKLTAAVPTARVVNLAGARHYLLVREADTLREIRGFMASLPPVMTRE